MKLLSLKILLFAILFITKVSFSQTPFTPKLVPPSPNAATLAKYGDVPVTYYNGLSNISIPIYNISEKSLSVPISISYHSSGIKVAEEAGVVGLGWALNFGGIISRTVIGEDDFESPRYFSADNNIPLSANYKPDVDYVQVGTPVVGDQTVHKVKFLNGVTPIDLTLKSENAYANEYEPDQYNFNFGGYSGKFVITRDKQIVLLRKEKIKIVLIEGTGSSTNPGAYFTFEITIPDGTVYTFAQQEVYENTSINSIPHVSSWYLTKITSVEGYQINFTYTVSADVRTQAQGSISETILATQLGYDCNNTDPTTGLNNQNAPPTRSPSKNVSVVHIDKINFLNGSVKFNYDSRTDLLFDKKLTTIQIYKNTATSESLLKYFEFAYDYFVGDFDPSVNSSIDGSISQRLKLLTITEKSASDNALPAHSFTYYEGANLTLPAKTSFAIDHWGYFNNKTNKTTLIPTFTTFSSTDALTYHYGKMTGTERNAVPNYSKAFSLKRITYPTGGYTEFEYENNDFDIANSELNDQSFEANKNALVGKTSGSIYYDTDNKGQIQNFPIDMSKAYNNFQLTSHVDFDVFARFTTNINCGNAQANQKVYFKLVNQTTLAEYGPYDMLSTIDCGVNGNSSPCTNRSCTNGLMMGIRFTGQINLRPGIYLWKAYAEDGSDYTIADFSASFSWFELAQVQNSDNGIDIVGSQRIKKITDNDGTNNIIKNFKYHYEIVDPNNSTLKIEKSAGRRMTRPQYSFWTQKACVNTSGPSNDFKEGVFLYRTSNSMIPLNGSASGAIVGYDRVEVTYGASGENGKSIFFYDNASDIVNYYGYYRTPAIAGEPNPTNGNLVRQEDYRYDGLDTDNKPIYSKVKENINEYSINETPAIVWGAEIRYLEYLGAAAIWQTKNHFFFYPSLKSYYNYSKTNTERLFDTSDFTKYTETKTDYFYENPNHLQLTKKEILTSVGQKRKFVYQYPLDLASGTNVYQEMVDAFIHTPVVTQDEYLESNLASTQNTIYKKWFGTRPNPSLRIAVNDLPPLFAPEKIEIREGSGPLRTAIDFLSYDDYGNLTQYRELNGLTSTLTYFTNYDLNADAGKLNLVKSTSNDLSQTTNYDYLPLVGLKSSTDINAKATNYEYDEFLRLKYIKDENNLIIASFCYNYAGQSVACGTVNNTGKVEGPTLALINSGGPLPLNLLNFVAVKKQNDAKLIWNTSEEKNTKSFDIEHSLNAKNWTLLSTIDAKGGKKSNYEYIHPSPTKGENYYRLKMNDADGKFEYSKIVNLEFGGKGWIYPNPVSNGEKLNLDQANFSEISQIEILGVNGKVLYMTSRPQKSIEMSSFPTGKYVLKLTNTDGSINNFNFLKQ